MRGPLPLKQNEASLKARNSDDWVDLQVLGCSWCSRIINQ